MKKTTPLLLLVCFFLLASVTLAADNIPAITSFTSSATVADRTALSQRTARIPVSWTTVNRPVFANLVFEQVLPDGGVINVELPRIIPWVNSNGDGIAAPVLPVGNASEINLRVRLVNLVSGQTLSERSLTLPIGTANGQGTNTGYRPAITGFATSATSVRADQLRDRSARVPVAWTTVNRPLTATLVFEQVLADGSVVNVELPRDNPWVNSSDSGVAAPVSPGGDAGQINLRVRLIDVLSGRVYDQRSFLLAIASGGGQPRIQFFTTTATQVSARALEENTARIPVSWSVENRPDSANLYFEQVFEDERALNIELPRSVPWVASSGDGVVAPVLPRDGDRIVVRVRLATMSSGETLDQQEFTLLIEGRAETAEDGTGRDTTDSTGTGTDTTGRDTTDGTDTTDGRRDPMIVLFNANTQEITPGGSVTVNWEARDAGRIDVRVSLSAPDAADALADRLPLIGNTTLAIPMNIPVGVEGAITLEAYDMNGALNETLELPLRVVASPCETQFFFGESTDCATSAAANVEAAFQTFERGMMLWRADTREIYVLADGGMALVLPDTWASGDIVTEDAPPEGMLVPQQGFGQAWLDNPRVRETLGWATTPEQGFAGQFQSGTAAPADPGAPSILYMSAPDGRIIRAASGAWNYVE